MSVFESEFGRNVAPEMTLYFYSRLKGFPEVLRDIGLDGLENRWSWVIGNSDLETPSA